MKPKPWSHSALDCHANCPKQYNHKYVLKDLPPEEKTDEQNWGTLVHREFELHGGRPDFELRADLKIHLPFLEELAEEGAEANVDLVERKVALSINPFAPCEYFAKNVWWRGVIDRQIVNRAEGRAKIVDYKTGKKKDDWAQLAENAIWTFMQYPEVRLVNAQYYWVTDQSITKKVWGRSEIDSLVEMFAPRLANYVQSFKSETFTPRQSGLCGWCPVKSCVFWRDRKEGRR